MKININSKYYVEAAMFTTKEQGKYSLNCLRVEPHPAKGALVIATDGHTLVLIHDEGGECDSPINIKHNEKVEPFCDEKRRLTVDDGVLSIVTHAGKKIACFYDQVQQKAFPAWQAVLPVKQEADQVDFNPEYLSRCGNLDNGPFAGISIWPGTEGSSITHSNPTPAVVRIDGREDVVCLVMPMRASLIGYPDDLFSALRPEVAEPVSQ